MKVTWLTQAGLLFENEKVSIIVDPYLSNSCEKVNPLSFRRMPIDESYLKRHYDILCLTHDHLDHTDPESYPVIFENNEELTVLASYNAWDKVRTAKGSRNYVCMREGTSWSEKGVRITAVKAEHSDLAAVGYIIDDGVHKYYVTGDTLYNEDVFKALPNNIYAVFLPINGKGNNMNAEDACLFAKKVNAKIAVPIHYGLFDELTASRFIAKGKTVLTPYETIDL